MPGGRPAHFETSEELQSKCDEYFIWAENTFTHLTITGLAIFLGFESRQSVYDYSKNGEFSYIIKTAKLKVENGYEMGLFGDKPTGSIFALKNMGWVDNQAIDHTSKGESLNATKDLSKLTDDELRTMATIQKKINAE